MANFGNILAEINAAITTNDNQEITGAVLNAVLGDMVNTLKDGGYIFAGVASPSASPGEPDANVFYIASTAGTYTNFGGLVVNDGEVAVLKYNGAWTKQTTDMASAEKVTELEAAKEAMQSDLRMLNIDMYGGSETTSISPALEQGAIMPNGSLAPSSDPDTYRRVRFVNFIRVKGSFTITITGFQFNVFYYTSPNTSSYASQEGRWISDSFTGEYDGYILCGIRNSSNTALTPSQVTAQVTAEYSSSNVISAVESIDELQEDVDALNADMYGRQESSVVTPTLEQGAMMPNGSLAPSSDSDTYRRVRFVDPIRVYGAFTLTVPGFLFNVFYYRAMSVDSYVSQEGRWISDSFTGNFNGYIRVGIRNSSNTALTPSQVTATVSQNISTAGLLAQVETLIDGDGGSVRGADMIKRGVKVSAVGLLSYLQAFCKYNGKYYSTNGSNIAEQDSSFAQLRTASINLGHGNSLQLVSGGKAWASGWDDQKMYKVDLSTLAVESTVTLPTTGYTTAVVDEANGWMYIFQRDSYPSTEAPYNFIVYDYVNDQIKSERVIQSFAAMQSADLYQGKIYMVYGLGTQIAPSGMRVYNTAGDVLATFSLDIFASEEPEGIMVDRDTLDVLVSVEAKILYKVTGA